MDKSTYTFYASDGNAYEANPELLQDWVNHGNITLEDTVTEFLSGQKFTVREILQPPIKVTHIPNPTYSQNSFAAYPRTGDQPVSANDLRGFNWGAFFWTWIWGLNHKKPILMLMLLVSLAVQSRGLVGILASAIHLAASIYIGVNGNTWAWESGRFSSVSEMRTCQRIWTSWAVGIFLATAVLFVLIVILAVGFRVHR